MNIEDLPLALTVEQAADVLQVSTWAMYRAIGRGEIDSRRVGRTVRVPRSEIARLTGATDNGSGDASP